MISRRLPPFAERNALTRALDARRGAGTPYVDLTASNPTRAGIPYPADLLAPLASPAALGYEPSAFGLPSARMAVAAEYARRGVTLDPGDIVLTASTSEAYTWLFKLLCNPGESVLVPRPSYPLFEHLTALEGVAVETYRLEYHGRWEIDLADVRRASDRVRAVIVVSPNNPTGSFVSSREADALMAVCRERGWALIADEVFVEYPLEVERPRTDLAAGASCLAFTLGGLSKALGLPQLKLGWIIAGGPAAERSAALAALELIADSFLSVGTPVQVALPALLARGASSRHAIQARVRANLDSLRAEAARHPACEVLRVEGGWTAVIRVPAIRPEERIALDLLEGAGILVHPGYFFDFEREAYIVVSLLVPEEQFTPAVTRVLSETAG